MRISDWSSDVCSSDLLTRAFNQFREKMKETEQLRHQQTLAEKKAQEERRGALLDFASEFERSVASAVDVLAEEVRKVSIASAELSKNAKDSAGGTQQDRKSTRLTSSH